MADATHGLLVCFSLVSFLVISLDNSNLIFTKPYIIFHYFKLFTILRVSVHKNQKMRGKFQNFKIAQTLATSGPY